MHEQEQEQQHPHVVTAAMRRALLSSPPHSPHPHHHSSMTVDSPPASITSPISPLSPVLSPPISSSAATLNEDEDPNASASPAATMIQKMKRVSTTTSILRTPTQKSAFMSSTGEGTTNDDANTVMKRTRFEDHPSSTSDSDSLSDQGKPLIRRTLSGGSVIIGMNGEITSPGGNTGIRKQQHQSLLRMESSPDLRHSSSIGASGNAGLGPSMKQRTHSTHSMKMSGSALDLRAMETSQQQAQAQLMSRSSPRSPPPPQAQMALKNDNLFAGYHQQQHAWPGSPVPGAAGPSTSSPTPKTPASPNKQTHPHSGMPTGYPPYWYPNPYDMWASSYGTLQQQQQQQSQWWLTNSLDRPKSKSPGLNSNNPTSPTPPASGALSPPPAGSPRSLKRRSMPVSNTAAVGSMNNVGLGMVTSSLSAVVATNTTANSRRSPLPPQNQYSQHAGMNGGQVQTLRQQDHQYAASATGSVARSVISVGSVASSPAVVGRPSGPGYPWGGGYPSPNLYHHSIHHQQHPHQLNPWGYPGYGYLPPPPPHLQQQPYQFHHADLSQHLFFGGGLPPSQQPAGPQASQAQGATAQHGLGIGGGSGAWGPWGHSSMYPTPASWGMMPPPPPPITSANSNPIGGGASVLSRRMSVKSIANTPLSPGAGRNLSMRSSVGNVSSLQQYYSNQQNQEGYQPRGKNNRRGNVVDSDEEVISEVFARLAKRARGGDENGKGKVILRRRRVEEVGGLDEEDDDDDDDSIDIGRKSFSDGDEVVIVRRRKRNRGKRRGSENDLNLKGENKNGDNGDHHSAGSDDDDVDMDMYRISSTGVRRRWVRRWEVTTDDERSMSSSSVRSRW
ncbi:hypothetical protein HDU76_005641, partial [Blyttiomyces sp. JEL0837]